MLFNTIILISPNLPETSVILRRGRDMIKNFYSFSYKVLFVCQILIQIEFSSQMFEM